MTKEMLSDALVFRVFDVKPTKSETRKLKILDAAIQSIAQRGFEATTFDAIGKMVKMQRTHVNYYFQSRDELLRTAVRYAIALGQEIIIGHVKETTDWRERFTRVVEGPFLWLERYPEHGPVLTIFYHYCSSNPEHRKVQTTIRQGGEDRMLACFEGLVAEKKLTRKRAVEIARQTQSLITGTLLNYVACDFPDTLAHLRKATVKTALDWVDDALARR